MFILINSRNSFLLSNSSGSIWQSNVGSSTQVANSAVTGAEILDFPAEDGEGRVTWPCSSQRLLIEQQQT